MLTTKTRLIATNQVAIDQPDFLQGDVFSRVTGLQPSDVTISLFFQNQLQPWPTVLGTTVSDGQVASGSVYFNEIPAASGFYNVRFRPTSVGFWRLVMAYTTGLQVVAVDFDVTAFVNPSAPGLIASFMKPST